MVFLHEKDGERRKPGIEKIFHCFNPEMRLHRLSGCMAMLQTEEEEDMITGQIDFSENNLL